MNLFKRIFIITVIIAIVGCLTNLIVYHISEPDIKKAQKAFLNDTDELNIIVNYLKDEESYVDISSDNGKLYSGYYKSIKDDDVLSAIDRLFDRGYKQIIKSDNQIYFIRWQRLNGDRFGLCFSVNNTSNMSSEIFEFCEPIEDNWFFFKEIYP